MDTYKEVLYAAGLLALISTGITLLYLLLKAYQFAVYALPHQTERRLAVATPGGRQQVHSSIAGDKGCQEVLEQVPGNISDEYGAELQQPSGTVPLSREWENVCIAARRNAEEHSVEPFVRENESEVDFQLSNHRDWQQPNPQLRQDICDLLPLLYQSGFNTEGFPNLEDYLYQTVGTLPCQSLLRLALDSVFEEFPEISAIQTKVYRMLKCHLSVINHPSITQFDDISLANHDFDRVVGPDFHNISGAESRPDLSLQTDFNDTYYSVFSQAQRQVYRVTERLLTKLRKDRANSCPDIVQQLHRETDRLANSNWTNTSFTKPVYPDNYGYRNDQ